MTDKNYYLNEWRKQQDEKYDRRIQKILDENTLLRIELNKSLKALAMKPMSIGLSFNDYQRLATTTAVYPKAGNNIYYPALGLSGEAGEVCNKISKIIRDFNDIVTDEMKMSLEKELGDVIWFVSRLATELGLSLDEIAENNIRKIQSRKHRNKLHGSGDNR